MKSRWGLWVRVGLHVGLLVFGMAIYSCHGATNRREKEQWEYFMVATAVDRIRVDDPDVVMTRHEVLFFSYECSFVKIKDGEKTWPMIVWKDDGKWLASPIEVYVDEDTTMSDAACKKLGREGSR